MKSIQIKNLRCISDTGEIEMRPLMILVGANSSGKSTFLRTFPLFKQSLEIRRRGPLLWYGPEVDFGTFETSVTRGQETMSFIFKYEGRGSIKPSLQTVMIEIGRRNDHDTITSLIIELENNQIIKVNPLQGRYRVFVNDIDYSEDPDINVTFYEHYGIVPSCYLRGRKEESKSASEIALNRVVEELKKRYSLSIEPQFLHKILTDSLSLGKEKIELIRKSIHLDDLKKREEAISFIVNTILFSHLDDIMDEANMLLRYDFESVRYIKPLRASAERYYRVQNVSVDELASDGHNMAMFLNELYTNSRDKESFQKWTLDNFKFVVETGEEGGHVSIKVKDEKNSDFDNIADTGSGYAQLLPIIILMWVVSNQPRRVSTLGRFRYTWGGHHYLAIEQPELHLHPKVQIRFADVVASLTNNTKERDLHFIIETHSKDIINRIGANIELGTLKPKDVSILLFDSNHFVRTAEFSSDGVLQNWPIGFFDPID